MESKIGIDASINSTAMCIDGVHLFNYTTTESKYKWIKNVWNSINFRFVNYEYPENYSEREYYKLIKFDEITDLIIEDIKEYTSESDSIDIFMEGYSYESEAGRLADIVTYSTILRQKLIKLKSFNSLNIITPKELKMYTCRMVYGFPEPELGKKGQILKKEPVSRNKLGIAGGSFKKHEMYEAYCDWNGHEDTKFKNFCNLYKNDVMKMTAMPKPFDDVIDAIFAYHYTI